MPTESTVQFVSILVSVAGLLGWTIHTIISYFIKSTNEKSIYIEKLVSLNQQNTEKFIETVNHQRTLDREMQLKHTAALSELTGELRTANAVNRELVGFLKGNARVPTV